MSTPTLQNIYRGSVANDGTGTVARDGALIINLNNAKIVESFSDIDAAVATRASAADLAALDARVSAVEDGVDIEIVDGGTY